MSTAPVKYLLYLQNFNGVFRNFWTYGLCGRVLICIWTILEISSMISIMLINALFNNLKVRPSQTIYFFSLTGFSVTLIILALYHSKNFQHLMKNFDSYHNLFADNIYSRKILQMQRTVTISVLVFCGGKITAYIIYLRAISFYTLPGEMLLLSAPFYVYNVTTCDFRYIFEYFTIHSILFVISEQLNAITRSIDNELVTTNEKERNNEESEILVSVREDRLKKFELWVTAYKNINCNSKLCNHIFSAQMTLMLLILTMYFIILLYSMTTWTVAGIQTATMFILNMFSMIMFLLAMYVISRAGQRVHNSAVTLIRKLCELYVYSLDNERHYKQTKDLLRCCYTHPIRINALGSVDINMSLLPSCVAFFTSYTVIALQFNNVL